MAGSSSVVYNQQAFSWMSAYLYVLNLGHTEQSEIYTFTFNRWNLEHESFYIVSNMPTSSLTDNNFSLKPSLYVIKAISEQKEKSAF